MIRCICVLGDLNKIRIVDLCSAYLNKNQSLPASGSIMRR
jgi:hypothetical protein